MSDLEGEVARQLGNLSRDLFSPERVMEYMKRSGLDFTGIAGSGLSGPTLDPYQVLGLERSASDEEIRARYRGLLRQLHPDTAGVKGTEVLFQIVMAAYEAVSKERGWE